MFHFDPDAVLTEHRNGASIIPAVQQAVDQICNQGYSSIFYIGIGGTYLYASQMLYIARELGSRLPLHLENAAEFCLMPNPHFDQNSLVVIESVSGDTKELVEAVGKAKAAGARVLGYVENRESPLYHQVDYPISTVGGGYYFWYTVTLRLMNRAGEFDAYDRFIQQLARMPENVVEIYRASDAKAEAFAKAYCDAPLTYLVGSGNLKDWAVCYGMCIMEEMQWMRTRPVSASDFFHGTLEVIERDCVLLLIKGEDSTRPMMDRVERFAEKICANVTVFDTRDYALQGVDDEFRGILSPLVMRSAFQRLSTHLEHCRRHPLAIRRYYRRLDY